MYGKVRLPDVDALLFWQIHGVGFCDAVGFVPCVDVWHLAVHTPHAQLVWVVAAGLAWQSRSRFPLASSKQMNAASQSLRHFTKVGLSETSMANAYSLLSFKWFASDMRPTFWVLEILIYCNIYKNYGFVALMTKLFVLLHHRNRCYGNGYYDKAYRYEIF
jgi:hypothetical protein